MQLKLCPSNPSYYFAPNVITRSQLASRGGLRFRSSQNACVLTLGGRGTHILRALLRQIEYIFGQFAVDLSTKRFSN
jgi:hypothetical protein